MNSDDLVRDAVALANNQRYDQMPPIPAVASTDKERELWVAARQAAGLEWWQLLQRHGVPWTGEVAREPIPAPGAPSPLAAALEDMGWTRHPVDGSKGLVIMRRDDEAAP
jgi:hypothetical protein